MLAVWVSPVNCAVMSVPISGGPVVNRRYDEAAGVATLTEG